MRRTPAPATACLWRETNNTELRFHIVVVEMWAVVVCANQNSVQPLSCQTGVFRLCLGSTEVPHAKVTEARRNWDDPEGVETCCPIWSVHFLWKMNHTSADTQHVQVSQILILIKPLPQCCTATWSGRKQLRQGNENYVRSVDKRTTTVRGQTAREVQQNKKSPHAKSGLASLKRRNVRPNLNRQTP